MNKNKQQYFEYIKVFPEFGVKWYEKNAKFCRRGIFVLQNVGTIQLTLFFALNRSFNFVFSKFSEKKLSMRVMAGTDWTGPCRAGP